MRPPIQLRKRTVPNGAKWCYPSVIATCYDRIGRRPWGPAGRLDPGSSPFSRGNPGWDG